MRYTHIWYKGRLYIHCILYKYKGRLSDDGLAWSTSYGGGMCPTNEWSLTCYSLGTTNQQTSYRPKVSKSIKHKTGQCTWKLMQKSSVTDERH